MELFASHLYTEESVIMALEIVSVPLPGNAEIITRGSWFGSTGVFVPPLNHEKLGTGKPAEATQGRVNVEPRRPMTSRKVGV